MFGIMTSRRLARRKPANAVHQVGQKRKRKREAETRDDVEEPRKKRFVRSAALDPDLRPPPPASAATSCDDTTVAQKRKREAEPQDDVREPEEPPRKRLVRRSAAPVPGLRPPPPASAATEDKTIAKERKREAAQEEQLRKLKPRLKRCFIVNAAVLPKRRLRPAAASGTSSTRAPLMEQPLKIHGQSEPEYQRVYHSVVDPMLVTSTGNPRRYSLALGSGIKQRLWETLNCPSLTEEEQIHDSDQTRYTEKFSTPTLKSLAPRYDVDISEEPKPEQPKRKRKAEPQDDVHGLKVPDLHPPASTSAATKPDDKMIAKKRRREAAQEEELQKRFIVNAAVLPERRPRPAAASGTSSTRAPLMEQPLKIHGQSEPEYQRVYHSVVDPMLVTSTGNPRRYSLALGSGIKQRLWETLNCPSLTEEEQIHDSEQTRYTEKFSTPTLKSLAPRYDVDISEEPKPEQPKRKRQRA